MLPCYFDNRTYCGHGKLLTLYRQTVGNLGTTKPGTKHINITILVKKRILHSALRKSNLSEPLFEDNLDVASAALSFKYRDKVCFSMH